MYSLPDNIPQCQHIRCNGVRCGSPALRGKQHCYYHDYTRKPSRVLAELEDAESIQLALRQVIKWVAFGMETKRAALILYALQIASSNLKYIEPVEWDEVVRDLPEGQTDAEAAADEESEESYAAVMPPFPPQSASVAANGKANGTTNGHAGG
jgi:hypothetical protein